MTHMFPPFSASTHRNSPPRRQLLPIHKYRRQTEALTDCRCPTLPRKLPAAPLPRYHTLQLPTFEPPLTLHNHLLALVSLCAVLYPHSKRASDAGPDMGQESSKQQWTGSAAGGGESKEGKKGGVGSESIGECVRVTVQLKVEQSQRTDTTAAQCLALHWNFTVS